MAQIIGLSDWDTSGQMTATKPRKGSQVASFLNSMISGASQSMQDKQIRRAAASLLGVPEDQIPIGMFKAEDLAELQKEKFKTSMSPKGFVFQTPEEKLSYEKQLEMGKESAKSEGLRNLIGMLEPSEPTMPSPVQGDMIPNVDNVPVGTPGSMGMGKTLKDAIIKGRLKKEYGIDLAPDFEQEKFAMEKEKFRAKQEKEMMDKEERIKQLEYKSNFIKESAQDAINTIAEVKKGKSYFGALGPIPTLNPWGYERKKWEANVNKLLAKKMVDLMTQMKSASKTGATGFGQLSEREGQILRDAATALNRGLSPEDAEGYLNEMEFLLNKVVSGESQSQTRVGKYTLIQE